MMHVLALASDIVLRGRADSDALIIELADVSRPIEALPASVVIGLCALFISAAIAIGIELRSERSAT